MLNNVNVFLHARNRLETLNIFIVVKVSAASGSFNGLI